MKTSRPLLSVIIPAHNEALVIASTVSSLKRALSNSHIPYEFIVIDDYSTDGTSAAVHRLQHYIPSIRFVSSTMKQGFGNALKLGVAYALGEYIVFVMADGSETPDDIVRMYTTAEKTHADCVFGNRFLKKSYVEQYPFLKRICNRLGNFIVRSIFRVPYRDITNACKLYTRSTLLEFGPMLSQSFSLSMEMALSAIVSGKHIVEVPIHWRERVAGTSKFDVPRVISAYIGVIFTKRNNFSPHIRSSINIGLLLLSFGYAMWRMFRFIFTYTWPIPILDHWNIGRIFLNNVPFFSMLLYTQNEHHIGVGAIINVFLVSVSHWNIFYETTCIGVLLVLTAFLAVAIKERIVGRIELFDCVIPLLFMNLYQAENLLWGFQIAFVLPLFFLFLFAYVRLFRRSLWRDCILLMIALLSTYSSFHGLIVAGLVYCSFLYDALRTTGILAKFRYGAWMLLTAIICYSYAWTLPAWYMFEPTNFFTIHAFSIFQFLQNIGLYASSLIGLQTMNPIIFIIPVLSFLSLWYLLRSYRGSKRSFDAVSIYAFFAYSVLFFCTIWIARSKSGNDLDALTSSRYLTHVIPLYFFLYITLQIASKRFIIYRFITAIAVILFFIGNLVSSGNVDATTADVPRMYEWISCYRQYEKIEYCDAKTHFSVEPDFAQPDGYQLMNMLKNRKWNLYR